MPPLPSRPSLFVGSSSESVEIAYAIQTNLGSDAAVKVWTQDVANPSSTILEDLLTQLDQRDFGVFVFSPDDQLQLRGTSHLAVRDNVLLELGLFLGRLGRTRAFIVQPSGVELHLPSDLLGLNFLTYDSQWEDEELVAAVAIPCHQIRKVMKRLGVRKERSRTVVKTDSYDERRIELPPPEQIILDTPVGAASFVVLVDDLRNAGTDVIVSSDDNHFTARGGVSKAILDKAGTEVRRQLDAFATHRFRQGHLAITTGGDWRVRAVIHAAVIDLDQSRYPTVESIRHLTRRVLNCAAALGARSVALPVLGGGFATRQIAPTDSVRVISSEIVSFLQEQAPAIDLERIALYLFRSEDADGLPDELVSTSDHA
jgi:O-acetyl-ADP-ribose deacetylase (regulator of RNase III)